MNPNLNQQNLKSWAVPSVLVAGGIGLLAYGLRPKTRKEKLARTVSYWAPPRQTLTSSQQRDIEALKERMNELRREIRIVWANGTAKRDGMTVTVDDMRAAIHKDNYPWPVQRIAHATFNIENGETDPYSTQMIAPPLQTAFAQLDVALFESSIANMEQTIRATKALAVLNSVRGDRLLWLAATYAAQRGTYIPAVAAQNYEICSAHYMQSDTQDAILANSTVLTWLALNTWLSDLDSAERKTQRALRKQSCRTPRVLTP